MFVSSDEWGFCLICEEHKDLRYGYCLDCSDTAKGEDDLCYRGGLGKYESDDVRCSIECKFSVRCRRKT